LALRIRLGRILAGHRMVRCTNVVEVAAERGEAVGINMAGVYLRLWVCIEQCITRRHHAHNGPRIYRQRIRPRSSAGDIRIAGRLCKFPRGYFGCIPRKRAARIPNGYLFGWMLIGAGWPLAGKMTAHNSRRPSMAFSMVISSVYSMSLPTGIPIAMRVTFTPARLSCCER
jgi:hypothetical protein